MNIYAPKASLKFQVEFEILLDKVVRSILEAWPFSVHAIILGGGYGKEQGGVCHRDGIELPYNDLDLVIISSRFTISSNWKRPENLDEIEKEYGIHIDLSPPIHYKKLHKLPNTLFWNELAQDYKVIYGCGDCMKSFAQSRTLTLDPVEASDYLVNRAAGLIWASLCDRGLESLPDEDFIRRNWIKAIQAVAESYLLLHNEYSACSQTRIEKLESIAPGSQEWRSLTKLYEEALNFKLDPDNHFSKGIDNKTRSLVVKLWIEVFQSAESQRLEAQVRCPESYSKALNAYANRNFRVLIKAILKSKGRSLSDPKASVYQKIYECMCDLANHKNEWEDFANNAINLWKEAA